jgi:hypothetical protein
METEAGLLQGCRVGWGCRGKQIYAFGFDEKSLYRPKTNSYQFAMGGSGLNGFDTPFSGQISSFNPLSDHHTFGLGLTNPRNPSGEHHLSFHQMFAMLQQATTTVESLSAQNNHLVNEHTHLQQTCESQQAAMNARVQALEAQPQASQEPNSDEHQLPTRVKKRKRGLEDDQEKWSVCLSYKPKEKWTAEEESFARRLAVSLCL